MEKRTRQLLLSGLFAAVMALLAQVSIPLPFSPVPITGQMFGVFLASAILGGRWGAVSMLVYVFTGALGLPVFSFAQGGLYVLLGPTGGYIWGFIPGSYLFGTFLEKKSSSPALLAGTALCVAAIYSLGALQLSFIAGLNLQQTIMLGVLPFLPLDIVKAAAASGLSLAVRHRLLKAGLIR